MAGLGRCFVLHGLVAAAASLTSVGCGDRAAPPPAADAEPVAAAPDSPSTEFAFAPTVENHVPKGTQFEILVEVGNADEASLHVVMATLVQTRQPEVRVELWTFDQRDKTKLEPKGDPVWLVPLRPDETPDGEDELPGLKRALSLPNSFKTRPIGLTADSPTQALQILSAAASAAVSNASAPSRLQAIRSVFQGVGDDVFFDGKDLAQLLKLAADGELSRATIQSSSSRRATASAGVVELEMLKTTGGWAVTGMRSL